jgi:hypothetical protein
VTEKRKIGRKVSLILLFMEYLTDVRTLAGLVIELAALVFEVGGR